VGVDREDIRRAELWDETRDLIGTFRSACRNGSTAEGLAALYAYESQIPAVAESKIEGLKKHYGIESPRTLAYFDVHIQADKEHAAVEQRLLVRYIDENNAEAVGKSVGQVLDALWEMLWGVEHRHPLVA